MLHKIKNPDLKRSLIQSEGINPVLILKTLEELAKNLADDETVELEFLVRGDYRGTIYEAVKKLSARSFLEQRRKLEALDKDGFTLTYAFVTTHFEKVQGNLYEETGTIYHQRYIANGKEIREIVELI